MKKHGHKKGRRAAPERLARVYEGPAVLGELLSASGCELSVDEVVDEFACALEEGSVVGEIVPLLWELEPRFGTAEEARRTFSNLFGLWDAVAAELDLGGEVSLGVLDPSAPVPVGVVDRMVGELEGLEEKGWRQARDRFENVQGEVGVFVFERLGDEVDVAVEVALELAFETWWVLDRVRGASGVRRATRAGLAKAFEAEDDGREPEPGLAGLATAVLWEQAADEERPLPESVIPRVERVLKAVRGALVMGDGAGAGA